MHLELRAKRLDVTALAAVLGLPLRTTVAIYRDGRAISPLAVSWCERLYGVRMAGDGGGVDSDGNRVSVCTVTRCGASIADAIHRGGGRTCSRGKLTASIEKVDYYIFVDAADFPEVKFIPATRDRIKYIRNLGRVAANGHIARKDIHRFFLPDGGGWLNWHDVIIETEALAV